MDIFEKIRKIEALIERPGSEGELQAALLAKERLEGIGQTKAIEYTVSMRNMWHKKLFTAICRKHKLDVYRYHKQKYTTAMVKVSKQFMDEVLWPEYEKFSVVLEELVEEVTSDVISKIHNDGSEIVIEGELEGRTE